MTDISLSAAATLRDAVRAIEQSRRLITAIVDDDGRLLGILSDGDIRRAILAGSDLDSPASDAMTRRPITGPAHAPPENLLNIMLTKGVAAIPVVDDVGRYVRVVQLHDFDLQERSWTGGQGYWAAVVMAGGEGRRLRPITLERPKPMINIGGVPLLERQVTAMVNSGLQRIYIATSYLGHVIESHFGDGRAFGADIRYLREPRKLGTAGALSLLCERPQGPLLVINGDVLTTSDFGKLLSYHHEMQAAITVAAVVYQIEIPFGVLRTNGYRATALEEKPAQSFFCNAGIYVLTSAVMDLIPPDTEIDMTDVITQAIAEGLVVAVFPIHEYWTDIGNPGDLERVLREFADSEAQ